MAQLSIAALVAAARSGKLISFPTDTIPAMAALPDSASLIYQAKQRQPDKPLILMADSLMALWPYIQGSSADQALWEAIAHHYWPGALTLVLPASDLVPMAMHPQTPETIGVRVPNCAIAQCILQQTGPLATTSINRSGQPALTQLLQVEREFPTIHVPEKIHWPEVKAESSAQSSTIQSSTVVRWDQGQWTVLRQGAVVFSVKGIAER